MSASSPPLAGRNGSPSGPLNGVFDRWNRYICISGDWPSGRVFMLALSMCAVSGETNPIGGPRFSTVLAPSAFCASNRSSPWKPPLADENEIGGFASQSWNVLTKKKTCVPFWRLSASFVAFPLPRLEGCQVQTNVEHVGLKRIGANVVSAGKLKLPPLGVISSPDRSGRL